ncbi:MAG: hypothetical protein Q7R86_01355 [bacterium]|nr:hypothetical protein [bacterium]
MEETNNVSSGQGGSGGMNWKLVVGIIVVVVIIGAIVFGMGGGSGDDTDTENTSSLVALLGMEGAQKCTVTSQTDSSESSGQVYIANGMMRGTFTSTAAGQTVQSNMVVKDNVSYVWMDASTEGLMMAFNTAPAPSENETAIDVNQEYSYNCEDWSADESVFELPSEVTFLDLAQVIEGQMPGLDGGTEGEGEGSVGGGQ